MGGDGPACHLGHDGRVEDVGRSGAPDKVDGAGDDAVVDEDVCLQVEVEGVLIPLDPTPIEPGVATVADGEAERGIVARRAVDVGQIDVVHAQVIRPRVERGRLGVWTVALCAHGDLVPDDDFVLVWIVGKIRVTPKDGDAGTIEEECLLVDA